MYHIQIKPLLLFFQEREREREQHFFNLKYNKEWSPATLAGALYRFATHVGWSHQTWDSGSVCCRDGSFLSECAKHRSVRRGSGDVVR